MKSFRALRQRGAASLIVVAVLFFVLSLVAAYTSRNLIFEQRTASNQFRATTAFQAAEAGLQWALTMLNAGRIDDNCLPSADPAQPSFRERYLVTDPATGIVDPAGPLTPAPEPASTVWPSCVFNGNDWACSCPLNGAPALAEPAGSGVFPAFRVRFVTVTQIPFGLAGRGPGMVRVEVNGCTRLADGCLDFPAQAVGGEGRAVVSSIVALRGVPAAPPVAALTASGAVNPDDTLGGLDIYNGDPASGGITVVAGRVFTPGAGVRLFSAPGTPGENSFREDPTLGALPDGRLFTNAFAVWPDTFRDQPAAVRLTCNPSCGTAEVQQAVQAHPFRVIWVDGELSLAAGGDIGSPAAPVALVVQGRRVDIDAGVRVFGLIYVRRVDGDPAPAWEVEGSGGELRGAAIVDGDVIGTGSTVIAYDGEILDRLRRTTGSFVQVPGTWRDF